MSPARYRLDVDRMVALDIEEADDFRACEHIFDGFWNKDLSEAYCCAAGIFAFNVNPYGYLSPCTMFSSFQYSLRKIPFRNAWEKMAAEYGANQNNLIPDDCTSCSMLLICARCAAWSETETGIIRKKVDYLCEYAKCLEKKFLEKRRRLKHEEEAV
jgi:radical SAM protein with 4Fe4S-binding SPASM domain